MLLIICSLLFRYRYNWHLSLLHVSPTVAVTLGPSHRKLLCIADCLSVHPFWPCLICDGLEEGQYWKTVSVLQYCVLYYYNSAQRYEQFLQVYQLYWAFGVSLKKEVKVKEVGLYSAFIVVPHTQGAQVRITQCYLQLTPYLKRAGYVARSQ